MPASALRILLAATVLAVAAPLTAEPAGSSCELPAAAGEPLAGRAEALAQFERLPPACLKQIVRECTTAAGEALLDPGTASLCSFGYEALLSQGFGGNFPALLAWWRAERQVAGQ